MEPCKKNVINIVDVCHVAERETIVLQRGDNIDLRSRPSLSSVNVLASSLAPSSGVVIGRRHMRRHLASSSGIVIWRRHWRRHLAPSPGVVIWRYHWRHHLTPSSGVVIWRRHLASSSGAVTSFVTGAVKAVIWRLADCR